jgi:hypothetical protein
MDKIINTYQFYISSTISDLFEERKEVIQKIISLNHIPTTIDLGDIECSSTRSILRTTIENSNYIIVLIGHKYHEHFFGRISKTEFEVDYALEKGIPLLAYLSYRTAHLVNNEEKYSQIELENLNRFINKVLDNAKCCFWENKNDLLNKVTWSLSNLNSIEQHSMEKGGFDDIQIEQNMDKNCFISLEMISAKEKKSKIPENINLKTQSIGIRNNQVTIPELQNPNIELIINDQKYPVFWYSKKSLNKSQLNYNSNSKFNISKIKQNYQQLSLGIVNKSTIDLNQTSIIMTFPNEIFLFENSDIELESPISNSSSDIFSNDDTYIKLKNYLYRDSKEKLGKSKLYKTPGSNKYQNRNNSKFCVNIYRNQLIIKFSTLLRSDKFIFDEILFIEPKLQGDFRIRLKFCCDEFLSLNEKHIPIEVI